MEERLHADAPGEPTRQEPDGWTAHGIPVEENSMGHLVTERSGFRVDPTSEPTFPTPGDRYEVSEHSVITDPGRCIEALSRDHEWISVGNELAVLALHPDDHVHPCTFCNPEQSVQERGIVDADLAFFHHGKNPVAYSCIACVEGS